VPERAATAAAISQFWSLLRRETEEKKAKTAPKAPDKGGDPAP